MLKTKTLLRRKGEEKLTGTSQPSFHPFRYHMDIVKMRLYQLAAKLP
jgi:hypothetical protein